MDKNLIWIKITLILCIIMGVSAMVLLMVQVNNGINNKLYMTDEVEDFCLENDMGYEIYMSGDKFCTDSKSMYPIRHTNGTFKFVIRGKDE